MLWFQNVLTDLEYNNTLTAEIWCWYFLFYVYIKQDKLVLNLSNITVANINP